MSSEPAAATPAPKKPSALWKWIKRIGCALFLMTFTCCGLTCTGFWWIERGVHNMNKEELDRFHAEGLQGGDVKAIFDRAEPKFRERFTLEELEAFLQKNPGLLDRENLHGVDFERRKAEGVEWVTVRSKRSMFSLNEWEIVCKVVDGVLVLVGISPGLDDVMPPGFRNRISGGGRRHRWHH